MGFVYLAKDKRLDIQVALKIPQPLKLDKPLMLERFYQEARAAARLCHPGLCQVYDVDEFNGYHYLTMRYIECLPLSNQHPT